MSDENVCEDYREMDDRHQCTPPTFPDGSSGWHCPVCDAHWIHDLSYQGPGYTNPVYRWERLD